MPNVPPVVWIGAAGFVLLLLGLCAAVAYAVLRTPTRTRIARWPASRMLLLAVAATLPWLAAWLAPVTIAVKIHGIVQLIGWLFVALLAFTLLILLPLAVVLGVAAWLMARRSRKPSEVRANDAER